MDLKLEVVPIPVMDVDAAEAFYTEQVGFHLDHDVRPFMHLATGWIEWHVKTRVVHYR